MVRLKCPTSRRLRHRTAALRGAKSDTSFGLHTAPSPSMVTNFTRSTCSALVISATRSVQSWAAAGEHTHLVASRGGR